MLHGNDIKEELSFIYAHAIATQAGYSFERRIRDRDSIDAEIQAKGMIGPGTILSSPQLGLQLKATAQECTGDQIAFPLPMKNYNELRANTMVPRICILLLLPGHEDEWVRWTPDELSIKGQAYWSSLHGFNSCVNSTSKTIYIKKNNLFNVQSLKQLMVMASKREEITDEWK